MRFRNFIGGSYQSSALTADQQRTVNMYVERMENRGSSTDAMLVLVPGLDLISTASASPGRAHFYENEREFAVFGPSFVEITESGVMTVRGTVSTDANPATICSNGDGGGQLLIVSGTNAYYYDLATNTLTAIAALAGKATMGSYLDGYGLVLDSATSTLYISAVLDFSSWTTGTDFAQRSKAPDKWRAMRTNGQYIGLYGEHSSEFWYNTGDSSFPFAPHPSGLIPYGIRAPFSLAIGEGAQFWLGQSSVGHLYLLRSDAFTPQVVSDFPHATAFAGLSNPEGAVGEFFNWRGHQFYRITFPASAVTYCYDATSNQWFEWRAWLSEASAYSSVRARYPIVAFGEHRVLDAQTGALYRYSATTYTDADDRPIRWMRRAPVQNQENELLFLPDFEVALENGQGTSGQAENPQIMLRISNDGGRTWGSEMWRSAGKAGEYLRRVLWTRLGAARQRVVELTGSDPIPWKITNAYFRLGQAPASAPREGAE